MHRDLPLRASEGAKEKGAYYTPESVVRSLLRWAVRDPGDRLLDPSCGDGRFVAGHPRSVGVESDPAAIASAAKRAPNAGLHREDFFSWAGSTSDRFECAAGNPPFIRYQLFKGPVRQRALALCRELGADFSALSSSWPLFLVATAHLLTPGGRMAFVVPAEIGHAPYAAPAIEHLAGRFDRLQIVAIREKFFPALSEDCWLLYAEGKGGRTDRIDLSILDRFAFAETPPAVSVRAPLDCWRGTWNRRLRAFLLPRAARDLYERAVRDREAARFGTLARIGIGYVTGANDFFHMRPSEAERWNIPPQLLQATVRNGRALPPKQLNVSVLRRWTREDRKSFLLRLRGGTELPPSVRGYLRTARAKEAALAYKCRTRDPWYAVPGVEIPDFFMSYMAGRRVALVRNVARCACTNSVHMVRLRDNVSPARVAAARRSPLFQLSCEIEGHPLGGGLLKLEPREACRILAPAPGDLSKADAGIVREGIDTLRAWRHYEAA